MGTCGVEANGPSKPQSQQLWCVGLALLGVSAPFPRPRACTSSDLVHYRLFSLTLLVPSLAASLQFLHACGLTDICRKAQADQGKQC